MTNTYNTPRGTYAPRKPTQSRERMMLSEIGITHFLPNRFRGFMGLHAFDTFVEEIPTGNSELSVSPHEGQVSENEKKSAYLWTDLVSSKKTRRDLEEILSRDFKIHRRDIHFSSEKPAQSISAQRIVLRGVTKEKAQAHKGSGYFLKNSAYGKEPSRKKRPIGDMYTLLIRTDEQVNEEQFLEHAARVESRGFYNFYHSSRFDKRLISHIVGAHIMRGEYQQAVDAILTKTSPHEMRAATSIREKAQKLLPKYDEISKLYLEEKEFFRLELKILSILKRKPKNYVDALTEVSQYTHTALRSFSAFLFNSYLSTAITEKYKLKKDIPLFPTLARDNAYFYGDLLKQHSIPDNFSENLKPFKSIFDYTRKSFRPSRIQTHIHTMTIIPNGVILKFNLPRETHVKTLLNNFFVLMTQGRVPAWVSTEKIDILQTLGLGSTTSVLNALKK